MLIPAVRLAEEASRLRSLKVHPKDLALRIPGYVGPTGTVLHDGHPYSMPPEAISMPATLYLYADRVRIVAGRYEVNHPRKFVTHEGSTLAAHRAAMVAAVSGKRGKRYLKRQQFAGTRRACFPLPHRDRSPPTRAVVPRHRSAAQHLAEPRSRGSSPRHGTGTRRASFWCHLH